MRMYVLVSTDTLLVGREALIAADAEAKSGKRLSLWVGDRWAPATVSTVGRGALATLYLSNGVILCLSPHALLVADDGSVVRAQNAVGVALMPSAPVVPPLRPLGEEAKGKVHPFFFAVGYTHVHGVYHERGRIWHSVFFPSGHEPVIRLFRQYRFVGRVESRSDNGIAYRLSDAFAGRASLYLVPLPREERTIAGHVWGMPTTIFRSFVCGMCTAAYCGGVDALLFSWPAAQEALRELVAALHAYGVWAEVIDNVVTVRSSRDIAQFLMTVGLYGKTQTTWAARIVHAGVALPTRPSPVVLSVEEGDGDLCEIVCEGDRISMGGIFVCGWVDG